MRIYVDFVPEETVALVVTSQTLLELIDRDEIEDRHTHGYSDSLSRISVF